MHRFFAPSLDPGDETIQLPRDEAEHAVRVLRIGAGETIAVFDGRGREYLARIISATRRDVHAHVLSRIDAAAEPLVPVTLVQAVLKGDKMDDVIRDAVMLGASAVQPVVSARAEVTVAALVRGARVDRWRRVALSSVKQCGRAVLPEIRSPLTLEHYLAEPSEALRVMLVEPGADASAAPFAGVQNIPPPADAAILVGPEGGWTGAEWRAACTAGARLMTLGARTLRADAVAIAALSVLQFLWDRQTLRR